MHEGILECILSITYINCVSYICALCEKRVHNFMFCVLAWYISDLAVHNIIFSNIPKEFLKQKIMYYKKEKIIIICN